MGTIQEECGTWVPVGVAARLKNQSPLTIHRKQYTDKLSSKEVDDIVLVCLEELSEGSGKVGRPSKSLLLQ